MHEDKFRVVAMAALALLLTTSVAGAHGSQESLCSSGDALGEARVQLAKASAEGDRASLACLLDAVENLQKRLDDLSRINPPGRGIVVPHYSRQSDPDPDTEGTR